MQSAAQLALLLTLAAGSSGCAAYGLNYLDPREPRCAGSFRTAPAERKGSGGDEFTVVSYNIKYAKKIAQALATLERGGLSTADVILLQEMDLPGTVEIARTLGYDYVYYPANHHPRVDKQFGLSILSPWPIRDDHKIVLPRTGGRDVAGKIAVAATVWIEGTPVGVINVHMAARQSPVHLGDQLQILIDCLLFGEICRTPGAPTLANLDHYVFAGDFNSMRAPLLKVTLDVLEFEGFADIEGIGRTHKYLMVSPDLIFTRGGLDVVDAGSVKKFFNSGSDHRPIWATLRIDRGGAAAWDGFDRTRDWHADTSPDSTACTRKPRENR